MCAVVAIALVILSAAPARAEDEASRSWGAKQDEAWRSWRGEQSIGPFDLGLDLRLGRDGFRIGATLEGLQRLYGASLEGQRRPGGFRLDGRVRDGDREQRFRLDTEIFESPGPTLLGRQTL
jgi:hypothetical protein